jgi:hypothetical protein
MNKALQQTLNIFRIEGDREVISKTLNESQNSPLKFLGDVDIFLLGKNFCNV